MKLLEAATVNRDAINLFGAGYNAEIRDCGVQMRLTDACEETSQQLVGDSTSAVGFYYVKPFAIEVELARSVVCEKPDDQSWVEKVTEANLEYPLSRALVIQPIASTTSWLGDAGVASVPLAGSPTADDYGTAVMAARKLWFETVMTLEGGPIMHVPPSLVPTLVKAGVLQMKLDGDAATILGDKVVISPGYDRANGPGNVFFSGPIKIAYMPIQSNDMLRRTRTNDSVVVANTIAIIDTPPCAIVRVGSYS
jgi:hypothetical protein